MSGDEAPEPFPGAQGGWGAEQTRERRVGASEPPTGTRGGGHGVYSGGASGVRGEIDSFYISGQGHD